MKHAWLFNHYAQEPGGPGGTRHYSLGEYLPDFGWSFSIIAASTELNTDRQRLHGAQVSKQELYGKTEFLWIRTPRYQGNGIGRGINMLTYSLLATMPWTTSSLPRPSVVIGSSVHPFAAWAAAIVAKRLRVPFIFEVRDLWPQTLIDLGRIPATGLLTKLLQKLELWLYRRADKIITLLPNTVDYTNQLGIGASKVVWLPNGVDLQSFPYEPLRSPHSSFDFMYFGAHGIANGLDNLLEAMRIIQDQKHQTPIRLRLIGDGPLKGALIDSAAKMKLTNVSFESPVRKSQIPDLATQADAFVFNLIDSPVFKYGISSNKLFDFLAAARPIVFCCSASNNPIEDAKAGITVPPSDPVALANSLIKVSNFPLELKLEMGRNGREYVELHHDHKTISKKLAVLLNACVTPD